MNIVPLDNPVVLWETRNYRVVAWGRYDTKIGRKGYKPSFAMLKQLKDTSKYA